MNYFIMTSSGMDRTQMNTATFGPFTDLSNAKLAASMLKKRGSLCSVENEANAKELDLHGVNFLKTKNPNGIQW